ncbi:MAG: alcohol dehydrogenase catalytic domain-containing protein [Clostridiales bacterium]|nr:alcohol dehydrogenase catalytic domain-containing protein [Clostridiales bacterium]
MQNTRMVAFLTARERLEIFERPMPEVRAGEVLVRMKAVGVCGSDVSYFRTGRTGVGEVTFPHVLGHECAGVVEAVGPGVRDLGPGDRVAVEPGYFCGKCEQCTAGRYNLCARMSFMGSAVADAYGEGALCEYAVRPANLLYRLPAGVGFDEGALIEPLSVGLHAVRRAGISAGARAAILGCGPIAVSALMVMRALGVDVALMTDMIPDRLSLALSLGALRAADAGGLSPEALQGLLPEGSLDAVFDTTCSGDAINASLRWLRKGGSLVEIGVPSGKIALDMQALFVREVSLLSSFRYANTYPALISLLAAGKLPAAALISHRFPFREAQSALCLAASRGAGVMKVMIEFP